MKNFEKFISTDYILLSGETRTEKAFSRINLSNPEYVIIYRIYEGELLFYPFLTKLLKKFKSIETDITPDYPLEMCLRLHEYDAEETKEISSPIPVANDPSIDELYENNRNNSQLIPLTNENSVVGVFDSRRQDENAIYQLREFGTTVSRENPNTGNNGGEIRNNIERARLRSFRGSTSSKSNEPPKQSTESESEKPIKVGKFVSTKIREKMRKGIEESIFVQLKAVKPPSEELPKGNSIIDIPFNDEGSKVNLLVTAISSDPEIAEILDKEPKSMVVSPMGNSNEVEFNIIPKIEGKFSITIVILHQSKPLGLFQAYSMVGSESSTSLSSSNGVVSTDISPGADLTMIIRTITKKPFLFEIDVYSDKLGIPYREFKHTEDCGDNAEGFFRTTFSNIEKFNPFRNKPEVITKRMADIGIDLYNRLFPDAFKTFYWKNKDKISTIQIISSEPWIPWEIIKPWKEENGQTVSSGFLCEDHALTRWLSTADNVDKPIIKSIKVVQPDDTNLQGARDEADFLEEFWNNELQNKDRYSKISSLDEVLTSLEKSDFDVLHFTTHGLYNKELATQSEILLENEQVLTPLDLSSTNVKIQKTNPLIILNACQTGNNDYVLTGIGGWSEAFLKKAASGFIGTLWSVGDTTALNFTKSLYKHLKEKKPLDESVRLARLEAKSIAQENGDPSWLAYSLYAKPNSKIELEVG